jgi:hypothetical protein
MGQTNNLPSMHHDNTAALIILLTLNFSHFISSSIAPIVTLVSGVYVLYNIRLQVINAGGISAYLKGWIKWKK